MIILSGLSWRIFEIQKLALIDVQLMTIFENDPNPLNLKKLLLNQNLLKNSINWIQVYP
jgi:hypothetical protein